MIPPKPPAPNDPRVYRPRRKPVTVAIGFAYDGGLLFCADTKISTNIKTNESKIEHRVSDDEQCAVTFAMSSSDLNFPRMAIGKCWEYVRRMDFSSATIEAVHDAAEFSLAEFYRDHIYPHPDRTPGAVFLELLVGIWLRGETRLYVSHETVLNTVDYYECIGSGAYLAKYLIKQYQKATDSRSLRDASLIAEFSIQSAIDFDEGCGGDPEMVILKDDGKVDCICPANLYPGTQYIGNLQRQTWKLVHELAQVDDNFEHETAELIQSHCAGIRIANDSCKPAFDNLRLIKETNPHRWD